MQEIMASFFEAVFGWDHSHYYAHTEVKYTGIMSVLFMWSLQIPSPENSSQILIIAIRYKLYCIVHHIDRLLHNVSDKFQQPGNAIFSAFIIDTHMHVVESEVQLMWDQPNGPISFRSAETKRLLLNQWKGQSHFTLFYHNFLYYMLCNMYLVFYTLLIHIQMTCRLVMGSQNVVEKGQWFGEHLWEACSWVFTGRDEIISVPLFCSAGSMESFPM